MPIALIKCNLPSENFIHDACNSNFPIICSESLIIKFDFHESDRLIAQAQVSYNVNRGSKSRFNQTHMMSPNTAENNCG